MKQLFAIAALAMMIAAVPLAGLMAGCTSNTTVDPESRLGAFLGNLQVPDMDGLTGFTIKFAIVVQITQSDVQYSRGTETQYKDYDVDCFISSEVHTTTANPVPIISRHTALNNQYTNAQLWGDRVAPWSGVAWNNGGVVNYTVTQTDPGVGGDQGVYSEYKPGRYCTIAGFSFGIDDFPEQNVQVPTYFKANTWPSAGGQSHSIRLPFLATLPPFNSDQATWSTTYTIEVYFPIGSERSWDLDAYQTHQDIRVSYDVDYISTYDLIEWDFPILNEMFGTHFSTMDLFRWDTTVVPNAPVFGELTCTQVGESMTIVIE